MDWIMIALDLNWIMMIPSDNQFMIALDWIIQSLGLDYEWIIHNSYQFIG